MAHGSSPAYELHAQHPSGSQCARPAAPSRPAAAGGSLSPTLPYPTVPEPTLPYPTVPEPTLPYPTVPEPTVPYPTVPEPTT